MKNQTPKHYIGIPLNNDMTCVIKPNNAGNFVSCIYMGTEPDIEWNNPIPKTRKEIKAEELFQFSQLEDPSLHGAYMEYCDRLSQTI